MTVGARNLRYMVAGEGEPLVWLHGWFGLHPTGEGGRAGLPVEVDTWLLPVQMAIDRASKEASSK